MENGITIEETLEEAISSRYLTYAVSTIVNRALPDARDGLKPVHRRILYAMFKLSLTSNSPFRKCAKIVGEVMGNYHPHGDKAIYDAMVRLAQDFSVRYTLIEGQGNFGNIDGDNAAAQRYTEARLDRVGEFLLEGIDEDSVDFKDNYDGSEREPEVLPASFPNLLANGSSGIAVGMATSIPPHNISELSDAMLKLIGNSNVTDEELIRIIPGPDFPTGGVIVEDNETILNIYKVGKGPIRVRGEWEIEDLEKGAWQIVIKSIPYQIQKSKLIEKIADLITLKKLPTLVDVRDESTEILRIVLEPKNRNVDAEAIMQILFRSSELQTRFSFNMNVLVDGRTPKVCSLRELLNIFLNHRKEVLIRRTQFRINKINDRLELLNGYLLAYINLDQVIKIIRNEDDPKRNLQEQIHLNERQAEAVLNLRLRALRRLEEQKIKEEYSSLSEERNSKDFLLRSEDLQWAEISSEIKDARDNIEKYAKNPKRLTVISGAVPDNSQRAIESMIAEEDVTVLISNLGWARTSRVNGNRNTEIKYREGDSERFIVSAKTTEKLLLFCSNGRAYTIEVANLPSGRGFGEPLRIILEIPSDQEIVSVFTYKKGKRRVVVSELGYGFTVLEDDLVAQTRAGKQILNLSEGDVAKSCCEVEGDYVGCISENRKLLIFKLEEIPEMSRGKGVRFQKFKDGGISDVVTFNLANGISWLDPAGRKRTEITLDEWIGRRAKAGKMAPRGFPKDNKFNL